MIIFLTFLFWCTRAPLQNILFFFLSFNLWRVLIVMLCCCCCCFFRCFNRSVFSGFLSFLMSFVGFLVVISSFAHLLFFFIFWFQFRTHSVSLVSTDIVCSSGSLSMFSLVFSSVKSVSIRKRFSWSSSPDRMAITVLLVINMMFLCHLTIKMSSACHRCVYAARPNYQNGLWGFTS